MRTLLTVVAAAAMLACPSAQAASRPQAKKAKPAAQPQQHGVDRAHFEEYLQGRVSKIKDAHKERMQFFADESAAWKTFWEKVRDERQVFELRVTRQTIDIFESLNSLDPRDHPATIANFEKMHGDIMRSFDHQQREKTQNFFADREARWKDFALAQDKERADFMVEAQAGWQDNKDALSGAVAAAPAPAAEEEEEEEKPKKAAPRKKSGAAPAKREDSPFSDDKWH